MIEPSLTSFIVGYDSTLNCSAVPSSSSQFTDLDSNL